MSRPPDQPAANARDAKAQNPESQASETDDRQEAPPVAGARPEAGGATGTAIPPAVEAPEPREGRRRRRRRALTKSQHEHIAAYLLLLPWLIGIVGITMGPLLASLYLSFTDYRILSTADWIGIQNYVEMFTTDPRFWSAVRVTFRYVFVSVPLVLAFALLLAMVLNKGVKFLSVYRAIYYLPSLLGTSVAVAVLWRRVFGAEGLVNTVLAWFGYEGGSWIGDPDKAIYTLITLNVWTFGSAMVIFLAGLRQIPEHLYEAASVDGASAMRKFFHITLPMLTPIIFFNGVLNLIAAFQAFTQAYIVSGGEGGPADSTLFYTLYLYQRGFTQFDMGYASAMAWVLLATIAAFTAFAFWTSKYWVHYGE